MRYFILVVGFLISLSVSAQHRISKLDQKISISAKQENLEDLLFRIAEKASLNISFNPSIIPTEKLISENFKSVSVREILNQLLPSKIEVINLGNSILLQELITIKKQTGKISFKGRVEDQDGNPIEEALIFEVKQLVSAISAKDGSFRLKDKLEDSDQLTFSISKRNCTDTVIRIARGSATFLVKLNCKAKSNKILEPIPKQQYALANIPSVLVPKKVQIRSFQSQATLFRKFQFSLIPGIGTNQLLGGLVENQYSFNMLGGYSLGGRSIEIGGVFNIVRNEAKYLQLAGVFNLVGEDFRGVQLAGCVNRVGSHFKGIQLSGLYNQAKILNGFQLTGGINLVDTLKGVQLAPVNIARLMAGSQFGVINIADSATGPMFGLINIVKKGALRKLDLTTGLLPHVSLSLKLGTPKFYNIYSSGGSYFNDKFIWNYGFGFGTKRMVTKERPMYFETSFNWLLEGIKEDSYHYGLWQANIILGNKEFREIQLNVGPSFNLLFNNLSNELGSSNSIAPYRIFNNSGNNFDIEAWVGFSFSIGFGNK